MIKSPTDFENLFMEKFGDIDRTTLSAVVENKLRFELGGEGVDLDRIIQAKERSTQILQYCFNESPMWLRIILWDKEEEMNLNNAGLIIGTADNLFRDENEEGVLYLYYKKYSSFRVDPIITSIINYEMAEEPSANITCYFIDFEKSIILNIYDDRGIDVYSPNKKVINDISHKFPDWSV